jgi:hypothetical protein
VRPITKVSIVAGQVDNTYSDYPQRRVLQMYLLIRYPGGIIVEGVVLARGRNRMRVVAPGFPETIELRRTGALWSTDNGEQVELDFIMSDRYQAKRVTSSRTCAAMVV